jgi:hypothetical protein
MAQLPQGPYILAFDIIVAGMSHSLELNCDTLGITPPGSDADDVLMAARSEAASVTLQEFADEFWAMYRGLLTTQHLCSSFTLWKGGITNTVRTFISGGVLATPNGTNAGAPVLAQQLTMTMRSATGRIGRLLVLENYMTGNAVTPIDTGGVLSPIDVMAAYLISGRSPVCARDRAFFVQGMNASLGQNEALFEERYRS